ncbi:MAG TPA: hypothetical protein VK894_01495 [Jiangellales bacterium]|nr:hypothetical protein [Jiangellales bacterium]
MPDREQRRVVVTSPRMRATRARRRAATREIDEQTRLGDVYMRSLMRAQLRLGLLTAGGVLGLLAALPLLFLVAPEVREVELLGVPLPWVLLGVLVYPVLVVTAWLYVRQAERVERDFTDLVQRR